MKKDDASLPTGLIGFRQPYGGIDHVDQWRELSGHNDATIELQSPPEPLTPKSPIAADVKRT
jgi:hypothetical protein